MSDPGDTFGDPRGHAMAHGSGGFGRAIRIGVLSGLIVVVLVGVALGVHLASGGRLPGQGRADADRVLLMAALPDEEGAVVAQVIALVERTGAGATLKVVDPNEPVTVPGTTFDRLRDAYPFGGGAGVARAHARLTGTDTCAYVALDPDGVERLIAKTGALEIVLPEPMNVFDGERLYTFAAGPASVDAVSLRAVLNGTAYLGDGQRLEVIEHVCTATVRALARYPGGSAGVLDDGLVETDLAPEALDAFVRALNRL